MAIWQAMKGESRNPKQHWDSKDLEYQHFSRASGQQFEGHIKKDDLILIYWPGKSIYMGLQTAVEAGPYRLPLSVPGAGRWPYGLSVNSHIWILDPGQGIGLAVAQPHIDATIPGRKGLSRVDSWPGIDWLIKEIRKRGRKIRSWP